MPKVRIAMCLALGVAALASMSSAEAMSNYKWDKRPLVVFAPEAKHPKLIKQRSIVAARRSGFAERHVVVIYVVGERVSVELGPLPGMSAAQMRARFAVPNDAFRALLIGKDGGTKLSSAAPLGTERLFATIDAMPMRVDEMRRAR